MLLVDKNIKELVSQGKLIVSGYKEENLKGIAYELSVDCIYDSQKNTVLSFELKPGDVVYIKSNEEIELPPQLTAQIIERNSVMRMGLKVDGPQYIPGHRTFCFLRVQNISDSVLTISKGFGIAQIVFEELKEIPEQTYDKQYGASFRNEKDFVGVGKYQPEYDKLMKEYKDAKEDLESLKEKIYGNVLTIMGVFVSIFTLVSVNIQAFARETISKNLIATVNLCLLTCIATLLGFVMLIVNKGKKKWFNAVYTVFLILLAASTIILALLKN